MTVDELIEDMRAQAAKLRREADMLDSRISGMLDARNMLDPATSHPAQTPVRAEPPLIEKESSIAPRAFPHTKDPVKSELHRRLYLSLSAEDRVVTDAVMLSKDPAFIAWLALEHTPMVFNADQAAPSPPLPTKRLDRHPYLPSGSTATPADQAAEYIRVYCQVESRRDLATNAKARERFDELRNRFAIATGRVAEVRG